MSELKYTTLNNGHKIPLCGMGTWEIFDSNFYYEAIKAGIRLIDTGNYYKNEKFIGEGIAKAIENNIVKREEICIVTKIWQDNYSNVEETLKSQLKDLQVDYVDVYLLHWPLRLFNKEKQEFEKIPTYKLWAEMESLVKKGLVKSIGVSNFNVQILIDIFTYCEIKPAVNEFELNPYFQRKGLIDFCKKFGIHVIAYGSLVKSDYMEKYKEGGKFNFANEEIVKNLMKKYDRSEVHIALNWAISQNVSVIPKTTNLSRISYNLESTNFRIDLEDIEKMRVLDANQRMCDLIDTWDEYGGCDPFS
jgi:diketogulonate reductase-like aldo/keto reductase